jgi:hypothetical protein
LVDKGDNILYLSHSIPELEYIKPLYVEIWAAANAPDVLQTAEQRDINEASQKIVSYIRERIKSNEILIPNYLKNFVHDRLKVLALSALRASRMRKNDSYVLNE